MTADEAAGVIGWLLSTTTGWNDQSVEAYAISIRAWTDVDAAITAAKAVSESWTERSRPPLAVLKSAYDRERERKESVSMAALPSAPRLDPIEGRRVAAQAYAEECRRQNREPNWATFNRLISQQTGETSHDQPTDN